MKTEEQEDREQFEEYQPPKKAGRKNKAEASKVSKESYATRRRPQPDSSDEELRPQNVPQTKGNEPIVTQGFENEITKMVITIPHSQMQEPKFQHFATTTVLDMEIIFSIEKTNEYVTIQAKLMTNSKKMEIQNDEKGIDQIEAANDNDFHELASFFDIRGKYVYMAGYEFENKNIKGNRKQLNSSEFVEIVKFKTKTPASDLFIYFHLKIEEYLCQDFVGLVNQGNTCYMNSYLQTLYHIPAVRNLVYEAEIQDQNKFPATLQQLFYNLDHFQKAASPEALVKSFGWGKHEASIQQDAQQFSCLFFEALQNKLDKSAPKNGYTSKTIDTLFKGTLNHYIRCKNVGTVIDNIDFRNENYEEFIDLQVTIAPTLTESLDSYTSEVHLQGDNAYQTEEYGKQQAFKGLDYEQEIDFGKWSVTGEKDVYELHAVLVHEGARAQSGHYFNYVKSENQWYKFNDENVQLVSKQRAFQFNFGGFHETIDFDAREMKVSKKFLESKTTAYMLVYIKQSRKEELMRDNGKLPEWIIKKNLSKIQMEEDKKNKKNYFHKVSFIDWDKNLAGSICSDNGFLNEVILQNFTNHIDQIPKQANLEEWLIEQKILEPKYSDSGDQKKKKSKKAKNSNSDNEDKKEQGIYLFYATDRQILMSNKSANKVSDFFKLASDPILIKAPLLAKKDEYLTVVKRYKVEKKSDAIETSFIYDSLIAVKKDSVYEELRQILEEKFGKASESEKYLQFRFYLEDQTRGPIKIEKETGPIPFQSPKFNQLLVCIVEEIQFEMTPQEKQLYSFRKYYEVRKNIITLNVAEQKGETVLSKKDLPGNCNLQNLRQIIFQNLSEDKKSQYGSPDNIIIKAKLKKGSKVYTQVFQPEWKTIKDITRIDERIQFAYSALTVQSRLLKYMIEVQYRDQNKQFSEPIVLVVSKDESAVNLVKLIKNHHLIKEMVNADELTLEDVEIVLMTKAKTFINDVVNDEGKVIYKGDLDAVLKKQKNAVVVVMKRTDFKIETSPMMEMQDEQDPMVNILLHHMSNSGQKIGNPLYIKVDRRMQLEELRNKILELIKDEILFWEGKAYSCSLDKVTVELYGKDSKKVIELMDLETLEAIKRLKIEEKSSLETKRKKSKEIKNSSRKQEINEPPLEIVQEQVEPQTNQLEIASNLEAKTAIKQNGLSAQKQNQQNEEAKVIILNDDEEKILANYKIQIIEVSDDSGGKEEDEMKKSDEEKGNEPIENPEITKIEGPETILGVFPRPKVLKIRVLHSYLTKPNFHMKFDVYD